MSDIFIYADETGNLDYEIAGKIGASKFFGVGTAVFDRDHGSELWKGMRLSAEISGFIGVQKGFGLPKGFHARNDNFEVRQKVYGAIADQAPRFDATFMKKTNAFPYVKDRGPLWLYKYTFYLHLMRVAPIIATKNDTLYVIIATLGTAKIQKAAQRALEDVCQQTGLNVVLCVWDSATSWGLQVADYGLWAAQRKLESGDNSWHSRYIEDLEKSVKYPWGRS